MARVDARDVLDPNAKTNKRFMGKIIGYFEPTGPNAWDDYRYHPEEGKTIRVLSGLKIQMERRGADFRMRHQGRVIRVRWVPSDKDGDELIGASSKTLREHFFDLGYVESFLDDQGIGAAAVIARKLNK
jgi:hypothetical protein